MKIIFSVPFLNFPAIATKGVPLPLLPSFNGNGMKPGTAHNIDDSTHNLVKNFIFFPYNRYIQMNYISPLHLRFDVNYFQSQYLLIMTCKNI
jgi:hypothetical protein